MNSKQKQRGRSEKGRPIKLCPICAARPAFLYTIKRFQKPIKILKCPGCELQMQAELPADATAHYGEDYYTGKAEYSYRDERALWHFDAFVWKARLRNIARFVPPPARFLDVGSAFGGFVEAAQNFGYTASGLDVSGYAVRDAKSRGLDIHLGELGGDPFAEESFDIITLIEVMEHLTEPRKSAKRLSRLLRPGGLLVIQTANFSGRQAQQAGQDYHYYLPGHYFYYSHKNLSRLLSDYGLFLLRMYRPTDFGLLPKLLKSRGNFQNLRDYRAWLRIARYHLLSKIHWKDFSWTSSMVLYFQKPPEVLAKKKRPVISARRLFPELEEAPEGLPAYKSE